MFFVQKTSCSNQCERHDKTRYRAAQTNVWRLFYRAAFPSHPEQPMPTAPPRVCCRPGCGRLTHGRFCELHARDYQKQYDSHRGSANERGYNARWQRRSKIFLKRPENALCACGCGRPSEVVDHKVPHRGDPRLFWDEANWQGMAKTCHDRKTATEDGGFGRSFLPQW